MSIDSFRSFAQKVHQDDGLQSEIRKAGGADGVSVETLASIAQGHGYTFTADEVSDEIGDAQLEGVSGGLARAMGRYIKIDMTAFDKSTPDLLLPYSKVDGSLYFKI